MMERQVSTILTGHPVIQVGLPASLLACLGSVGRETGWPGAVAVCGWFWVRWPPPTVLCQVNP